MTDTRLHFYFTDYYDNVNQGYGVKVDNAEEDMHYLLVNTNDYIVDILFSEYTESSEGFDAVDIYSVNGEDIGAIFEMMDAGLSMTDIVEIKDEECPSLTYLGTLDWSGLYLGEVIEEFYVGELEEEPSTPSTTWTIGNKTVSSLMIGNKEVESIVRTSDSVVLYSKSSQQNPLTPNSVSLISDNNILSYVSNDVATLNATVLDANNNAMSNVSVEFFKNSTSIGTATTNVNGIATKNYSSTGEGDVSFTASVGNLTSPAITIEDCIYACIPQIDITKNGSTVYYLLNNDTISNLPITYKIEFDMKTSTAPTSGAEQRLYWTPTNLWSGSSQPSEAIFIGYAYNSKMQGGKRLGGSTSSSEKSCTINSWNSIRIEKINNNSAFYIYDSDVYFTWWTLDSAKNYSTWQFGLALWSSTTFSVRNIKIKPL